jgi:hypothetical protein
MLTKVVTVLAVAAALGTLTYAVSAAIHGPTHNIGALLGDLLVAGVATMFALAGGAIYLRRRMPK